MNPGSKLLSEAQILAAPAEEYMSPAQLAFFRARLVAERDGLLESAHSTTEHLADFVATPDPADRASQEEDHTLELRVRDRERKMLHKIDQAIERIDNNDYGYCEESGEPIGIQRLLARPTATFSVEAQERHEIRSKMRGG
ncbi:RNA polymerase-binding protein DksA [Uliginosibacterium flavum]|uniref:RNA polymerase-binding transcription factor DksA n=1 Tax=Uliginosibacterium flavum TaxID=1396831 RepID=A0ABV2THI7_9RHOO